MTGINHNGYTDRPAGHAAAIATFLEMRAPPDHLAGPGAPDLGLKRLTAPDPAAYRDMFRSVGTNWLWNSRLRLDDAELSAILSDPAVEAYFPER